MIAIKRRCQTLRGWIIHQNRMQNAIQIRLPKRIKVFAIIQASCQGLRRPANENSPRNTADSVPKGKQLRAPLSGVT